MDARRVKPQPPPTRFPPEARRTGVDGSGGPIESDETGSESKRDLLDDAGLGVAQTVGPSPACGLRVGGSNV